MRSFPLLSDMLAYFCLSPPPQERWWINYLPDHWSGWKATCVAISEGEKIHVFRPEIKHPEYHVTMCQPVHQYAGKGSKIPNDGSRRCSSWPTPTDSMADIHKLLLSVPFPLEAKGPWYNTWIWSIRCWMFSYFFHSVFPNRASYHPIEVRMYFLNNVRWKMGRKSTEWVLLLFGAV